MRNRNMAYCWDSLEGMSTAQLDDLLQEELQRTQPDGENVRLILKVLEERDGTENAEPGSEIERAWGTYLKRTEKAAVTPVRRHGWLLRVASIILVIGVIALAIPQQAQAEGLFDRVAHWTENFFQLFSFGDSVESSEEYVFRTDNPGLQQVYEAVVETGITEPVVPMWLPEGYELLECDTDNGRYKDVVSAVFQNGEQQLSYSVSVYFEGLPSQFFIDEPQTLSYEMNGVTHSIMQNSEVWTVVWINDNIECHISINCQEEKLYRLIKSIYSMEVE